MLRHLCIILTYLLTAILLISFAVFNHQSVEIKFFPFYVDEHLYSLSMPFYIYIFVSLFLGIILGECAAWLRQSRYKLRIWLDAKDGKSWQDKEEHLARSHNENI